MSQVKLNLQPPPNVDFVTGYPGIPPGPERPQAAVKGAIEVRIPAQGVKAKWVRIELRKVETLPGGGAANTFYDFVGPSPVNLWSSPDEYSILRSQDFPFSIRIPESIPPTVSLDNRAGIGYELVASVCTKGKRSFLRKAKSIVVSTISSIIIDKHELHSTWPVYCQPETRHMVQDGINLSVQRNNTCYGPGDRIGVTVVVKSDSLHTIMVRTLELSLKETTVFRAGILGPGKKNAPQERQVNITESKLALNVTLYGGSSHLAELSCALPPAHTTTTLNAARHIDVTYTLCIKAFLGAGAPLVMELPVIISNWQRNVSHEAISRIGPAPSLSLFPAAQGGNPVSTPISTRGRPADAVAATLPLNRSNFTTTPSNVYNTLPISSHTRRPSEDAITAGVTRYGSNNLVDDFGATRYAPNVANTPLPMATSPNTPSSNSTPARRPDSSGGGNRFTVTNAQPQDMPQSTSSRQRSANATGSGPSSGTAQRPWPTAEEEKLRLYEQARAQVARVQGPSATPPPAIRQASPPPQVTTTTPSRVAAAAVASPTKAARTTPTPAAALYAQAINAQNRSASGPGPSAATLSRTQAVPQYLTADEEKAALRRYEEAKRAVDRTQQSEYEPSSSALSAPIAYESLFPATASTSRPEATDEPPPFDSSAIPQSHLSEKERLRRAYEASDAAARTLQNGVNTPPPISPPTHGQYTNALEEKEALRRKFEARDNAQAQGTLAPQPPPRTNINVGTGVINVNSAANERTSSPGRSPSANAAGSRPTPLPPAAATSRVLSAAEEKALLRAKFEARDAPTNRKPAVLTNGNHLPPPHVPSTPPPLMPRPPVEYIKETQEEDARVSRLNGEVPVFDISPDTSRRGTPKPQGISQTTSSPAVSDPTGINGGKPQQSGTLDIKPFSPFRAGFEGTLTPGSPPGEQA